MKILLGISLMVNVILVVLYYQESTQPPIERIILEEKPAKVIREEVLVPVPTQNKIKKRKKVEGEDLRLLDGEDSVIAQDYEEAVENIETSKRDYLINQLGISDETLKKEGNLRSAYILQSNKVYEKYQMGEVPIAERRRLLDLEEKLQKDVIDLYGKSNWEKFQKYQLDYNKQVIKRVKEDNAPAILMGP